MSQHLEEEEDEDSMPPPPRSGMVRAFSHLPAMGEADRHGPFSQRGAQAVGQLQRTEETEDTSTPRADGISAAKASGVFDAVRQLYNRDGSPHFMDEDGNLRPRDEARQQGSPAPRDARSPQFGAGAPTSPAWGTGHAANDDDDFSHSPRTSSSASDNTRPWYMPPITPEDLDSQHSDNDEAAGYHSAPTGRPEAHDLVYRTPGASTPKLGLNNLLYRYSGSPEEAKENNRGFYQNAAGKSKNPAPKPPSNLPKDQNNTTSPPPPPKPSTTRLLTEGEKQLVKSIFGDSIKDLDKVEIRNRQFFPFQPSGTTVTPNGNIYPGKNLRSVADFSTGNLDLKAHLIHEMTHVFQRQNGMNVLARGLGSAIAPYDYELKPGKKFHQYPMEQQATIIADYFLSLQGEKSRPRYRDRTKTFTLHTPAEYEALIPWLKDRRKNVLK